MNNKQGTCKGSKLLQFTICGVGGSPIELGRRLMKDGDDQYESEWGSMAFYHARVDYESGPRLVFKPREISYDGKKAAGEGLEWDDQTHSGGVAYWTVKDGVARQYIMPGCY